MVEDGRGFAHLAQHLGRASGARRTPFDFQNAQALVIVRCQAQDASGNRELPEEDRFVSVPGCADENGCVGPQNLIHGPARRRIDVVTEKRPSVASDLKDAQRTPIDNEQNPVGLDRPRDVNRLTIATS
jgi:hypothetical protein